MRVTDVPTGGRALSYDALQEAARRSVASEASAQIPAVQETEKTPKAQEKAAVSSGLGAAVLHGCIGDFYRSVESIGHPLTDLTLPQIVVIGQESSGKSSVLESLAMLPLFPRDSDICTRLPILLKMRHMSHGNVEVEGDPELMPHCPRGDVVMTEQQIKMRLIYSDSREPVESERNFTPEEAAQLMRKWMDQIVKDEHDDEQLKGVVDHVLEIEIRSPNVPNLNLIDLPGIVAGKLIDEPDDMMQRTRALVEKYLQQSDTLVLAVVPAFERVRNSQAFQLMKQIQKDL
ncbi:hypothetical protein PHPALM_31408 [Phytophthora palmivora]|uniref:Dynamin-type G domain-containing protein n=1 Tax=Phytophthora palmivora TaxID=4796 RepID=A0A2P4X2P6_9STRA|nr:hypothetical protein PHPALM_31408 [Phytophthora palmivora]